jgi:hypothetical protein
MITVTALIAAGLFRGAIAAPIAGNNNEVGVSGSSGDASYPNQFQIAVVSADQRDAGEAEHHAHERRHMQVIGGAPTLIIPTFEKEEPERVYPVSENNKDRRNEEQISEGGYIWDGRPSK